MPQSEIEYVAKDSIFDIVFGESCACSDETEQVLNDIIEQVRAIPAADVVPVRHGRWLDVTWCGEDYLACSICGYGGLAHEATKYCPNCGAKMDSDKHD